MFKKINPLTKIKGFIKELSDHAKAQDILAEAGEKKVQEVQLALKGIREEAELARKYVNKLSL